MPVWPTSGCTSSPRSSPTIPAFLAFSVIPFGGEVTIFGEPTALQLVDLPVGVLVCWPRRRSASTASCSPAGRPARRTRCSAALRSAAQVISYEIAIGLSFVARDPLLRLAVHLGHRGRAGGPAGTRSCCCPASSIFVIAMVGETNRAPFDLPEAECELVGGFHTEYSSLKFALFFLAEYVNMVTVSAMATTLFLGGWQAPWPLSRPDGSSTPAGCRSLLVPDQDAVVFLFVFIWLRGTLPRLRYDQFMRLGWKVLVPVSLLWIVPIFAVRTYRSSGADTPSSVVLVTVGIVLIVLLLVAFLVPDRRDPRSAVGRAAPSDYPVPPLDLRCRHRRTASRGPQAVGAVPADRRDRRADRRSPLGGAGLRQGGRHGDVRSRQGLRCHLLDDVQEGGHRGVPGGLPAGPRRATTAATSSTGTRTGWRSASAASCAPGPARRTRSTSRAGQHRGGAVLARVSATAAIYQINYLRCIGCGLCIEACPTRVADDDQLLRAGRRQPAGPDLHQGAAARAAAARAWSSRRTRCGSATTSTTTTCTGPTLARRPPVLADDAVGEEQVR